MHAPAARSDPRLAWINVVLASCAMVATLPGRTQGLGLITEPLLLDLSISRVDYARLNFWATLLGAGFCLGFGRLFDRLGPRPVLAALCAALAVTVCLMTRVETAGLLLVALVATRGFGQSALSAASISLVGLWFQRRLARAMAVYSVLLSVGFMIAFVMVKAAVERHGWRPTWLAVGLGVGLLVPAILLWVRKPVQAVDAVPEANPETNRTDGPDFTLVEALKTPAFWLFGLASAVYLLVASGIGLFNESILAELGFPAEVYARTLAVTAIVALAGNFLGGWLVERFSSRLLLAAAMALLSTGLLALPHLRSVAAVMTQAVVMGLAGGFITVLFFTIWRKVYGPTHLGQIQGVAQMLTVLASALGPMALAECHAATGSYAFLFRLVAGITLVLGAAALVVQLPRRVMLAKD
jgi:MFS family permease